LEKQISKKLGKDIEKRIEFAVTAMSEIQKKIDDLNRKL